MSISQIENKIKSLQRDIERRGKIHAQLIEQSFRLGFQLRIHADADVGGRSGHVNISFILIICGYYTRFARILQHIARIFQE